MAHVLGTNNLDSSEPYKSEHVEEMDMKGHEMDMKGIYYSINVLYSSGVVVTIEISSTFWFRNSTSDETVRKLGTYNLPV